MKLLQNTIISAMGATIAFAASSAAAACPTHQVIFLFDQSGSMASTGANGAPKWETARTMAETDWATVPNTAEVGIYAFGNTTSGGAPYLHALQPIEDAATKGSNASGLLATLRSTAQYNGAYLTPLSSSACDAIELVWMDDPMCGMETKRMVYLYTDGLENSSPTAHQCYSATSSVGVFNEALAGQGFGLDAGSWERKLANMAWVGNPDIDDMPGTEDWMRPILNVRALFDWTNALSGSNEEEPAAFSADAQSISASGAALFAGLATITYGSYYESRTVNGVATKIPMVGDTDPTPLRSCVEAADRQRVLSAYGRSVRDDDPLFSGEDLAKRDVNNDLVINTLDYYLVIQNYGKCAQ